MTSLWLDLPEPEPAPALMGDATAEVAVIGGGIIGVTAALMLAQRGGDVLLIDAGRLGHGTTGYTTAKLSSLHGAKYAQLAKRMGTDSARAYGELSERGIARVRALAGELGIDCDLRERDNFTYAPEGGSLEEIESEVQAAGDLGLPASFAGELDLPFGVEGAVRFANQAEFHPQKYVLGLAAAAKAAGARIHENTRAMSLREGSPATIGFENGEIRADRVIVATHIPFPDRGLFWSRTYPMRSYAIAVEAESPPSAMYLSTESTPHSIRTAPGPQGELLIVGGAGHKAGQGDPPASYRALEEFARVHWGTGIPVHRWSSHDPVSTDGMPMVGALRPGSDRALTATGFSKWGLAAGSEAAAMLADACTGGESDLAPAFDPWRRARGMLVGIPSMTKEGLDDGMRMVVDRLKPPSSTEPAPGSGAVLGRAPNQTAVYRDEDGNRHELSARCTHLGCIVNWNDAEKSWDCPCHGSRFAPTGEVIEGPAVNALPKKGDG